MVDYVANIFSGVATNIWGSLSLRQYSLIRFKSIYSATIPRSLASLMESQSRAFNGTMTRMHLSLTFCKDAGYWKSMLFPKPVGKLATTSDTSKQFKIAFCMVFNSNLPNTTEGVEPLLDHSAILAMFIPFGGRLIVSII